MIHRLKKQLTPGLALGVIALVVAVGGSSIAVVQAQNAKKSALKGRFGGGTTLVTTTVAVPPQGTNSGLLDQIVTCPSAGKAGDRRATSGGVIDPIPGQNLAPLQQKTDGPQGDAWRFQFDNDSAVDRVVQLRVLCTLTKLNVKR